MSFLTVFLLILYVAAGTWSAFAYMAESPRPRIWGIALMFVFGPLVWFLAAMICGVLNILGMRAR